MTRADHDLTWDEVHHALVPLMRADDRTNIRYIARDYAGLAAALLLGAGIHGSWAGGALPTLAFVPLAGLVVGLVATFQHRLSGLAHEASHYVLFRNRVANELASDLLLLFPLVAMTQKYRAAHLGHHRYVNDPERDPDLIRLNRPEPHHFPLSKPAFWRRYVLRALWPPSILRYLVGRARAANLGGGPQDVPLRNVYRSRVARTMRGAYWLSLLTTVHLTGSWSLFWLFWVVPLLTIYPLLMQLREIAHHSNAPDAGDLTNSRVFRVHPLLHFCVFGYGQDYHLTHHLFAMLPHYRLPEAHAILSRYLPYREQVVVCQGYFFRRRGTNGPSLLDLLSASPRVPSIYPEPVSFKSARMMQSDPDATACEGVT